MDAIWAGGILKTIEEPCTWAHAKDELIGAVLSSAYGAATDEQELLANEVRIQTVPENVKNYQRAVTILRGYRLAEFLKLSAGKEEWMGDRSLTLALYISDEEHFQQLFGELMARGWSIGEKEQTVSGAKRKVRGHASLPHHTA